MKNKFLLKALILILAVLTASAGTWSTNKFFYQPALNARGATEKSNFDTGLNRADTHLSHFKTLGDPDYSTLAAALTTIGSTEITLTIPAGTLAVATNTIIPANIHLRVLRGALFQVANGVTLTIQGGIEAGPYQIFSWTGTGAIDLSASPTTTCPLAWWGAQGGLTNDIATALSKAIDSTRTEQAVWLTPGVLWRLATPVVKTRAVNIQGEAKSSSYIYVDVGGSNIGIYVNAGSELVYCKFKGFSFVGPASGCLNALKLSQCDVTEFDVNFYCGSTSYAFYGNGIEICRGQIFVSASNGSGYSNLPHDGVYFDTLTSPLWQSNANDLNVVINGVTGTALGMDGTNAALMVNNFRGVIQGAYTNPFIINKCTLLNIQSLYVEGGGSEGLIENCSDVHINNLLINDNTADLRLANCDSVSVSQFQLGHNLIVGKDCRGVVLGPGTAWDLLNYAPDTTFAGPVALQSNDSSTTFNNPGHDARNYFPNALFSRFQSGTVIPDGWTNGVSHHITWSQEASTVHAAPYSAKAVVATAADYTYPSLSAATFAALKGQWVNWTFWLKIDGSQSFSSFPYASLELTVPTWTLNTAYKVGDAINSDPTDGSGFIWECLQAGTSAGAQPTWDRTLGATTTDGGVVWSCRYGSSNSSSATPLGASDVGGEWRQLRVDRYVPRNATALTPFIFLPVQTGGGNGTFYLAEPCLMTGRLGPRGLVPNQNEFQNYVQVGANKWFSSEPAAGTYCLQGDLWWIAGGSGASMGKKCITSGVHGSGDAWEAMPNTVP